MYIAHKGTKCKDEKDVMCMEDISFHQSAYKLLANPFNSITELPRVLTFVSPILNLYQHLLRTSDFVFQISDVVALARGI
jgi:hypothetical protein